MLLWETGNILWLYGWNMYLYIFISIIYWVLLSSAIIAYSIYQTADKTESVNSPNLYKQQFLKKIYDLALWYKHKLKIPEILLEKCSKSLM